jgi:hypothetical protein
VVDVTLRPLRPDTVLMPLPNGQKVRVWRKDIPKYRHDILVHGNVFLRRPKGAEVYERVDPESIEAAELTPGARRVDSDAPPIIEL